jgi:hypothetical protein
VARALSFGVEVVELDAQVPFTAARARNAGFERLARLAPGARFVQFVDGDCELADGWIDRARTELESRPELGVVCGRLRERSPEASVYNRLADLEWDAPVGDVRTCGGIAMMRAEALRQAGGFDPSLIAGEEGELCVRLRARGWVVARLADEMALHDIAMTRFGQWWTRSVRAGYAYALGAERHGAPPERHCARDVRSVVFWGLLVPILAIGPAWPTAGASLALLLAYPLLFWRVARRRHARRSSRSDAALYALGCVAGKFPQALGLVRHRLSGRSAGPARLIEYKGPVPQAVAAR